MIKDKDGIRAIYIGKPTKELNYGLTGRVVTWGDITNFNFFPDSFSDLDIAFLVRSDEIYFPQF